MRFQLQQTQGALTHLDDETRSQSLHSSAFLSCPLSLLLVSVDTGTVVDANARLFQSVGWERYHVIGPLLTAPYKHLIDPSSTTRIERQQFKQRRLLVENKEKQMVPSRPAQQYKSGQEAIVDVACGRRQQQWSVWRLYLRSGELCDIAGTCWAGELEDAGLEDDKRQQHRRPKPIMFALSVSEAVVID